MSENRCVSINRLKQLFNEYPVPINFLFEIPELSNMILEYLPNKRRGTVIEVSKDFHRSNTELIDFICADNINDSCFIQLTTLQMNFIQSNLNNFIQSNLNNSERNL